MMKLDKNYKEDLVIWALAAIVVVVFLGLVLHSKAYPQTVAKVYDTEKISIYYSPATKLEPIDVAIISSAKKTIDISTYALTDKPVADALLAEANKGVHIRIYRDLRQYAGEIARPTNEMSIFTGNKNVEIKIKHSSVLAHLKAYVVDYGQPNQVLRDGSANWSESGEDKQDNSLILITSPISIKVFEDNYNVIWNRTDNRIIQ